MKISGEKELALTTDDDERDLLKINTFLQENNIKLVYTDADDNYLDFVQGIVVVSRHQSKKDIIYTILHELGHYFSDFFVTEETHTTRVIEEVLAWDGGRDVAYSLRIDIDEEAWKKLMIMSISKYIEK